MSMQHEHSVKLGRAFAMEFQHIERWDPGSYHTIRWAWPSAVMVRIGDLLTVRKEKVDRKQWRFDQLLPVTVHNDGRISKRKMEGGKSYTMDLWFARPGDLLVAKIDLKNGAIAIVPEGWENVAVTNHFLPYVIDRSRVDAAYLHRVFQMEAFRDLLWRNKVGAEGRKEVKIEFFLDQEIPLPPLKTQQAIVAHWQAGQQRAAELENLAQAEVDIAQRRFEQELGIGELPKSEARKAFALDFSKLKLWGVRSSFSQAMKDNKDHDVFPMVRLRHVIEGLENGWSPQCYNRPARDTEWGVLKLGAVSFGHFNDSEHKALPPAFVAKAHLEIRPGDVLIIRGNVLRLVGAFAFVGVTRPKLMLPDLIFRVRFKKEDVLDPQFLVTLMRSPELRQQIESVATGTSPTMKKVTIGSLLDLEFPLPPVDRQRELVKVSTTAQQRSQEAFANAAKMRKRTEEEVEEMVMGTKAVGKL